MDRFYLLATNLATYLYIILRLSLSILFNPTNNSFDKLIKNTNSVLFCIKEC